MTTSEAESIIREKEGRLCVRLNRRADGTVVTQNCAWILFGAGLVAAVDSLVAMIFSRYVACALALAGVVFFGFGCLKSQLEITLSQSFSTIVRQAERCPVDPRLDYRSCSTYAGMWSK
jgi:altronate dehydratase